MSLGGFLRSLPERKYIIQECGTKWTYFKPEQYFLERNLEYLKREEDLNVMMVKMGRCGIRCGKAVLLVFNLIFFVTGMAVMVVGVWCVTGEGRDVMLALAPTPAHTPTLLHLAYGLIGAGAVVLVTSFLGVWATLKENKWGLGLYVLIVLLVIGGEVAVGVMGVLYQLQAVDSITASLTERVKDQYAIPGHETFTLAVDYVQYQLQCCGVSAPDDWEDSTWGREVMGGEGRVVPLTCCTLHPSEPAHTTHINPKPINETLCQSMSKESNEVARHQQGCVGRVAGWVRAQSGLITGVGVGVGIIEVAGLVAAASLCRAIRSYRD